jgi:hypothetical protein
MRSSLDRARLRTYAERGRVMDLPPVDLPAPNGRVAAASRASGNGRVTGKISSS